MTNVFKKAAVAGALAAAGAAALAGCNPSAQYAQPQPQYQYVAVCVSRSSMMRLPDSYCNGGYAGDSWGYFGQGQTVPAVNQRVTVVNNTTNNFFVAPTQANGKPATVEKGGVAPQGGTVQRGGLGVPSKTPVTVAPTASATQPPRADSTPVPQSTARRLMGRLGGGR